MAMVTATAVVIATIAMAEVVTAMAGYQRRW